MNHGVVVNILKAKYLFNKNEAPKIAPVITNPSRRPPNEYAQSFFVKKLICSADTICLIPLFPSVFANIHAQTKIGMNKKYPVMNQYKAGFREKFDFKNGSKVNRSRKKYTVKATKIAVAF